VTYNWLPTAPELMARAEACAICDELGARDESMISQALGDYSTRNVVLDYTDRLAVIPSVGPLVPGHSLMVTRFHVPNLLASLHDQLIIEVETLLKRFLHNAWVPARVVFCFEHATLDECQPKRICTTTHAHLHLVPLTETQAREATSLASGTQALISQAPGPCDASYPTEYVALFTARRELRSPVIVLDASDLPSQYLRQKVSIVLGLPVWDWRELSNRQLLMEAQARAPFSNINLLTV